MSRPIEVPNAEHLVRAYRAGASLNQLSKDLGFSREDPAKATCRGILAAQKFKPQAVTLAESRGIRCAEVDLALLRGEREPDLTLFTA